MWNVSNSVLSPTSPHPTVPLLYVPLQSTPPAELVTLHQIFYWNFATEGIVSVKKNNMLQGLVGEVLRFSVHCIHPLHIIQWRIYIIQLFHFQSVCGNFGDIISWLPLPRNPSSASVTDQIPLEDRFFLAD